MNDTKRISEDDKLPVKQKIAYALGGTVEQFSGSSVGPMWMPILNLGFGISPGALSIVGVLQSLFGAIVDPLIGNMSDNARTRWGRRRPFIFIGAALTAIFTPLTWCISPGWSEMQMLVYVTLIGLVVHSCVALWAMPYNSLMLEMTPSYDERTRISAYRTIVMKFGALVGTWILPLASSKFFANPATGQPDLVKGILTISIVLSGATLLFGALPALFVPERYYAKEASKQPKEPLIKGFRDSIHLKPLWYLILIVLFQVLGYVMVGGMGFYINVFYISKGQLADAAVIEGMKGTTAFIVGLGAVPFWTWVCEKLDKKWTLMIILGSGFVSSALNFICLTPKYPYLQIIPAVFYASVTASIWLILPSMLADVVDLDEVKTSCRREGNINAVFGWFFKFGTMIGGGLSGFILVWTGFEAKNGANQAPGVIHLMLILFLTVPAIFWSIAVVLLWRYPLDRKKMTEIRRELEARRGAV
ncbi:MAG: MFS transporter [Verrucomicrobiae bacterium]